MSMAKNKKTKRKRVNTRMQKNTIRGLAWDMVEKQLHDLFRIQSVKSIYLTNFLVKSHRHNYRASLLEIHYLNKVRETEKICCRCISEDDENRR